MEMTEGLLKELQTLQVMYKSNFDLVGQKVDSLAEKNHEMLMKLQEEYQETRNLNELLKQVLAEKDAQIQKLIKGTSALIQVTDQLTTRFSATSGNG